MTHSNAFLFAALGAFVCGCYSLSPRQIPPTAGPLAGNPRQVQVTRVDGAVVTLRDPAFSADSLVGFTYIRGGGNVRLAISKTDIKSLSASAFSASRTAGAVARVAAASAVVLYIALRNSKLEPSCSPNVC